MGVKTHAYCRNQSCSREGGAANTQLTNRFFCYFSSTVSTEFKKIVNRCTPPPHQRTITNTGSTGNYGSKVIMHTNKHIATNPLIVTIPNGDMVTSTNTCDFDLPSLSPEARRGHIFPNFPRRRPSLHWELYVTHDVACPPITKG